MLWDIHLKVKVDGDRHSQFRWLSFRHDKPIHRSYAESTFQVVYVCWRIFLKFKESPQYFLCIFWFEWFPKQLWSYVVLLFHCHGKNGNICPKKNKNWSDLRGRSGFVWILGAQTLGSVKSHQLQLDYIGLHPRSFFTASGNPWKMMRLEDVGLSYWGSKVTFQGRTVKLRGCMWYMWFIQLPPKSVCLFSRWWFQIFLIFTSIWGRFPIWLIFFRWVETTNQFFLVTF